MAATTYKVTLRVNIAERGFSESYYLNSNNGFGAAALELEIKDLIAQRDKLLGVGAAIVAATYVDVTKPRIGVTLVKATSGTGLGSGGPAGIVADNVTTGIMARLYALGFGSRAVWFLAPPDVWVQRDPTANSLMLAPGTAFWGEWQSFKTHIENGKYAIRVQDRVAEVATRRTITGIGTDLASKKYEIFTAPDAPGVAVGDTVLIRGLKGTNVRKALGKAKVVATTGTSVVISKYPPSPIAPVLLNFGQLVKSIPTFKTVDDSQIIKVGGHKVGKAFGAQRGRSSVRA